MAGAARGVYDNVSGQHLGALFREAELEENVGDVFLKRGGVRVPLRNYLVELRLRIRAARAEAVVPHVERFERTTQTFLYQRGDLRNKRRGKHLLEHRADALFGNLAPLVEAARDVRGRGRRIRVYAAR